MISWMTNVKVDEPHIIRSLETQIIRVDGSQHGLCKTMRPKCALEPIPEMTESVPGASQPRGNKASLYGPIFRLQTNTGFQPCRPVN